MVNHMKGRRCAGCGKGRGSEDMVGWAVVEVKGNGERGQREGEMEGV